MVSNKIKNRPARNKYNVLGAAKKLPYTWRRIGTLFFLANFLIGCMGYDAISNEVRAGGTVLVAVDVIRNKMPNVNNAVATFTDSDGVEHPVKIRHLLRVQPDPVSSLGVGFSKTTAGLYAGQKLAIVDMVDPLTFEIPASPPMAVGPGALNVAMPDIGAYSEHSLSILPQDSLPTKPANLQRIVTSLEPRYIYQNAWLNGAGPLPHVVIQTKVDAGFEPTTEVAGVTFRIKVNHADMISNYLKIPFGVTKLTGDPNVQLAWHYEHKPLEDYSLLIITLSNPHGFFRADAAPLNADGKSEFLDLSSVAIGWPRWQRIDAGANPFEWLQPPEYIDIEGNKVSGLSAVIVRQI